MASVGSSPWLGPEPDGFDSRLLSVGAEVEIHGVQSRPILNGRRGRVLFVPEEAGGRVGVYVVPDPEVWAKAGFNTPPEAIALRPQNIKPWCWPSGKGPRAPAAVAGGCFADEADARMFSEILDLARLFVHELQGRSDVTKEGGGIHSLRSSPEGLMTIADLTDDALLYWDLMPVSPGVFGSMSASLAAQLQEQRSGAGSSAEPPLRALVEEVTSGPDVWRWGLPACRLEGEFILVEDSDEGAVLVLDGGDTGHSGVYLALGIAEPIVPKILQSGAQLPIKLRMRLLPFRGRLVYDGTMMGTGPMGSLAPTPPRVAARAAERVALARAAGTVITGLHSTAGPPAALTDDEGSDNVSADAGGSPPEGITSEVREAWLALQAAQKMEGPPWTMRRMAYSENLNRNHLYAWVAAPRMVGGGATRALNPTPEEVLLGLVECVTRSGGRAPKAINVDSKVAIRGTRALLRGTGVVVGYYPPGHA
ncbi:unnamed protein product [Pedinophyceae sp. YPF-701]|nr:unnamed protein product [Pedinophyceae sp. YPF-701]